MLPLPCRVLPALLAACLLTAAPPARAEAPEEEEDEPQYPFRQSVGVSPALLAGALGGNYEYLAGYRHGILMEAGVAVFGASAGSWSAGTGYRQPMRVTGSWALPAGISCCGEVGVT